MLTSLRRRIAERLAPSLADELREIEERRARAPHEAHDAFHRLWSAVASGAAYDKRMWIALQTELDLLGVRPQLDDDGAPDPSTMSGGKRLPWLSILGVGYVFVAMMWVFGMLGPLSAPVVLGPVATLGYGMTQLGYVLLAAGVFTGRFGVLRLRRRSAVLTAGALAWIAGVVLSNL